jgi:Mor family transcriptional regulator
VCVMIVLQMISSCIQYTPIKDIIKDKPGENYSNLEKKYVFYKRKEYRCKRAKDSRRNHNSENEVYRVVNKRRRNTQTRKE